MPVEPSSRTARRFAPYGNVINIDTPTPEPSHSATSPSVIDLTTPPQSPAPSDSASPPPVIDVDTPSPSPEPEHRSPVTPPPLPSSSAATTSKAGKPDLYGKEWRERVRSANVPRLNTPEAPAMIPAPRGVVPTTVASFSNAPPPVLKPARTTRGGFDAVTRYYTIHQNAITITKSDGDPSCTPRGKHSTHVESDGTVNYFEKLDVGDKIVKDWLKKLGKFLANEVVKKHPLSAGQPEWILSDFPQHYTLWIHHKGQPDGIRTDPYLYGSSNAPNFRSPKEFAPHAIWLMGGAKKNSYGKATCKCRYCAGGKQLRISNQLEMNMGNKVVTPKSRKAPAPSAANKPILYKDCRVFPAQGQNEKK